MLKKNKNKKTKSSAKNTQSTALQCIKPHILTKFSDADLIFKTKKINPIKPINKKTFRD